MQQRDSFDVVKDVMRSVREGLMSPTEVRAHRHDFFAVASRMERLKVRFPAAIDQFGLGEEFAELVKALRGAKNFFRSAGLL